MRPLPLLALAALLAGCDTQAPPAPPVPEPSPLEGTWTLPFSFERLESVGIRYAYVELYELTVRGDSARAGRRQGVWTCDGRGGCGPLCQTTSVNARGLVSGGRVVFDPAPVVGRDASRTVEEARLSAERSGEDSLRVRLVVDSGDPDCAFDGEAVLVRDE